MDGGVPGQGRGRKNMSLTGKRTVNTKWMKKWSGEKEEGKENIGRTEKVEKKGVILSRWRSRQGKKEEGKEK